MKKNKQIFLWLGLTAIFIYSVYSFQPILMPFLMGLLVAYAMNPAVRKFEGWGLSRSIGAALMIISFFLVIALILFIAIPFIQAELLHLASRVPQYGERIVNTIRPVLYNYTAYISPDDIERLRSLASTYMADVISWGIRVLVGLLTSSLALANLISLIVITPIVAFYCLRDWQIIMNTIDSWFPRPYAPTLRQIFSEINANIGGFARGQAVVCLMVGAYYTLTLSLVGLDFGFVVGIVIGVIAFIPYVGAIVGFMLSIGIAFSQYTEWESIGVIAAIFFVGQILEGYLFIPYFVGDRIKLHPVWVIFAILAGGVLYGFVGILFALPIAAALGVLLRHALQAYLKSPYYLGKVPARAKG